MKGKILFFILICSIFINADTETRPAFLQRQFPDHKLIEVKADAEYLLENNDNKYHAYFTDKYSDAQGYAGKIVMILILDQAKIVLKNIIVFEHNETPGFLTHVIKSGFLDRYKGKKIKDIINITDVDGVSGCTFSSKGIFFAIHQTLISIKKNITVKKNSK